jgi:hypothetical protein
VEPRHAALDLSEREAEQAFAFRVWPPESPAASDRQDSAGRLTAVAEVKGKELSRSLVRVEYPHIPIQTLFPGAEARLVPLALERGGARVGYVAGAGDDVAASLSEVGYEVVPLDEAALSAGALPDLDAIVLGVRAYNVNPRLPFHHKRLMEWVEAGGTLVAQYNTVNRLSDVAGPIGPWPFEITRERVTDESSPLRFDPADDPVLRYPNEITEADFEGWVQERGLYFAANADSRYRTPLLLKDAEEPWSRGALLVGDYGKGRFVYTGLSFFRQLPAGVPGAYRLFANLLANRPAARGTAVPSGAAGQGEESTGQGRGERADDQSGVRN